MLVTTSEEFIKEYKKDIIKYLEKSGDSIVSQAEDNRVKQIIENLQHLNPEPQMDPDEYNVYLMEQMMDQYI